MPYLYGASHRAVGYSTAYSLGTAAGGAAPMVSAALRLAMGGGGSGADLGLHDPAHYAAAIWLAALALLATAALLTLRRVAPQADSIAAAHSWAAAAAAAATAEGAAGAPRLGSRASKRLGSGSLVDCDGKGLGIKPRGSGGLSTNAV